MYGDMYLNTCAIQSTYVQDSRTFAAVIFCKSGHPWPNTIHGVTDVEYLEGTILEGSSEFHYNASLPT
jgi:hypothetical protein